jgi:alkanesulfonate monooxygenase SsuD/methylene tetrahydromethanopterin reductase-like flavin-dependent oxidoreductase (luciferase family)
MTTEQTATSEAAAISPGHPWVNAGQGRVRFGVLGGPRDDWPALRDFVQTVEGLGFDSYARVDHPLLNMDPWTVLAALAVATHRLRLGTQVNCVYYRNPVLLARVVADVDRISGGRAVLGLGSGDMEGEFRGMGLGYPPIKERQATLDEHLQVVPRLLRGETVSFQGRYVQLEDAELAIPAIQRPYVPILVAGGGERTTLRYVAQYADASNLVAAPWGGGVYTAADAEHKYAVLRRHCAEAGRPFDAVVRSMQFVPVVLADSEAALARKRALLPQARLAFFDQAVVMGTPEQAIARLQSFVSAGCQYFSLAIMGNDLETLHLAAERVVPAVQAAAAPVTT